MRPIARQGCKAKTKLPLFRIGVKNLGENLGDEL
jgi:hypothetical protein